MAKAFVIAETENGARELCAGARSIADGVVLCIAGAPAVTGVADSCVHIDVPAGNVVDDAYASVIKAFDASGADVVLAEQTLHALSLVGRLAAAKGAAAIAGVTELDGDVASSMYFGGTGVRTAKPATDVKIYTVVAGTFDAAAATGTDAVEEVAFEAPAAAVVKTGSEALPPASVDLAGADAVVACGRGFQAEEDLQFARDLAAKIGAEVGCSRPLSEGVTWFPREAYVGVSGQMISPKIYFAIGVSGQMQHMVGCAGAGTVVAINKDKNAPVFKQCDYGFVGDLKMVLPELTAAL
ncbi:electron transfer flavoprotein subunit alpha [Denitrobacterium detoxificans]|uniref:Electron transfer flavoprotein alpha subunit apoprotein n=1 Tax=Denitrobacterium detoxificans TaxID=79604 RepID=A0A172RXW9_9ACTN|nr:electron transfer flavoprotein subunit alpha/FixB family protein [Denitrobacterium detoxificans]ANE22524.1 electron transfer flavoprotein subunit alpha [Denitrobacterium detoxificans]SEO99141.1 electron transfer flavoprotein alpha subunit apoprotein [Denitrobacterium detoxificans]